ncbi:MAG: alpha-L-fucosidase [Puniceicoccales bacterium]|jgi:alpha-L-fucosidase|nr:alpha-L-fucosidase [Puniceicoccales bacterium]
MSSPLAKLARIAAGAFAAAAIAATGANAAPAAPTPNSKLQTPNSAPAAALVIPTPAQVEWADAEIGVMFHFDMPVFHPRYNFRRWGTHPPASSFAPTALDTDQWLAASAKMGAKYAVLVAKHCSGFSLWPTAAHEYSVKNSPYKNGKGDIVAEFVASCKKYGIKPGIYASSSANGFLHVDDPGRVKPSSPVTQKRYTEIVEQQLTELWTNYGELFEIWFDGGVLAKSKGGPDAAGLLRKLQPNAIVFQGPAEFTNLIRWVGNENGVAPDPCWATARETTNANGTTEIKGLHGAPLEARWCPGEADFPLRLIRGVDGWFWRADQRDRVLDLDKLLQRYEWSVGRNANMLLGIVVDPRGLVPDADVKRMAEFGAAVKRLYGSPLPAKTITGDSAGNALTLELTAPASVDRLVLQEEIALGERVLEYVIKGKTAAGEWRELARGTNIGHKRIVRFAPVTLNAVRLEITKSKAPPVLRTFSAFAVESTAK